MAAVFLVLLASLLASARRVQHLDEVSLETETVEDGKEATIQGAEISSVHKDNLDLQAPHGPGFQHRPSAAAKILMQEVHRADGSFHDRMMMTEVKRADASSQEVHARNVTQATGNAMINLLSAVKHVSNAIFADAKAKARAELSKTASPGSDNSQDLMSKADAIASLLIDEEASLREKTELLVAEDLGGELILAYMLEGYDRGKDKTVERVLDRLHFQLQQLEKEARSFLYKPKDVFGFEQLQRHISALDEQVKAMHGKGLESEEIDLTKPLLLEESALFSGIVQVIPDLLKVQIALMRKIVEKKTHDEGKAVNGMRIPPTQKMKTRLNLNRFLKAVEKMEHLSSIQATIKDAIEHFIDAEVSTVASYRLAREELRQAVKATMENLEYFDANMWRLQKTRIDNAVTVKKQALLNAIQ